MKILKKDLTTQVLATQEVSTATSSVNCLVYNFESYAEDKPNINVNHKDISDLVSDWDKNETRRKALEEARRWISDTLHDGEGDTIRTLRLKKGWSQVRLAEMLSTSQSHVARIERGTENLAIGTCRRLSKALGVDMNTLNDILCRQELLARQKVGKK